MCILYEVKFYYDRHGKSEIVDFLDNLKAKATSRILLKGMIIYETGQNFFRIYE